MNEIKIKILKPDKDELDEAFEYYEYELEGLGNTFLKDFRKGINRILLYPNTWSPVEKNIRKCVSKNFRTILYTP